jgi:hypothetical protein
MQIFRLIILSLSLISASACAAPSEKTLTDKARALNAQVRADFGVSLGALPLLLDASPNGFFPVEMLESAGKWGGYKELEKAGYIRIELMTGLPDGTNSEMQFARFLVTPRGEELQAALRGSN